MAVTATNMACTGQVDLYDNLPFCKGSKSLPGVRNHIFGIPKRDVVTYPIAGGDAAASLDKVAVYAGNFVLAADKFWHKMAITPNAGEIKSENQGAYGSKTFKNTVTVNLPGTEEKATGYIAETNNDEMLYLVPQRNGKYRLIGSEAFTPELKLSQDTGKASTDANQTTIEMSCDDEFPAPFYQGEILTSEGKISGKDGKPIVATAPATPVTP